MKMLLFDPVFSSWVNFITKVSIIKSNERNEDSFIGLADFLFVFFSGKSFKILIDLGIYAFFEFN